MSSNLSNSIAQNVKITTTILDINTADIFQFQPDFSPQAKIGGSYIFDKPIDFYYRLMTIGKEVGVSSSNLVPSLQSWTKILALTTNFTGK